MTADNTVPAEDEPGVRAFIARGGFIRRMMDKYYSPFLMHTATRVIVVRLPVETCPWVLF